MAAQIFPFGTALTVVWHLTKPDGTLFDLSGYTYRVYYRTGNKETEVNSQHLDPVRNNLWISIPASEPVAPGEYAMRLVLYQNGNLFCTINYNAAFVLSRRFGAEALPTENQEEAGQTVHLFTVAEFYLLQPVIPTIGLDKNWYVNGVIVTDSHGDYVSAEHTVRYDEDTKCLIIDEGRVDSQGQSIQQTITDVATALADWEARYVAAEGSSSTSVAGDGSRWGSYKSAEAVREENETSRKDAEGTPADVAGADTRWGAEKQRQINEGIRLATEERMENVLDSIVVNFLADSDLYEQAVEQGFEGTRDEWLQSTMGVKGVGIATWLIDQSDVDSGTTTHTITLNDSDKPGGPTVYTFTVKNGKGISSVAPVGTPSAADSAVNTYRVGYSDSTTPFDFNVKNGKGIVSVVQESAGVGSEADNIIRVNYSEGNSTTFVIKNGQQGNTGSSVAYPYELINNLTTTDTDKGLTAAMGKQLQDTKIEAVNVLASVEDVPDNYYTKSETATYVTGRIADNLTTNDATQLLSAKQGKVLQDTKVNTSDIVNDLTTGGATVPLSAQQGVVLEGEITQLGQELFIPITEIITAELAIVASTNKYGIERSYRHLVLSVEAGDRFLISAPSSTICDVAFVTSNITAAGGDLPLVPGTTTTVIEANHSLIVTAPEGSKYIIVYNGNNVRPWNVSKVYSGILSEQESSLRVLRGKNVYQGVEQDAGNYLVSCSSADVISISVFSGEHFTAKIPLTNGKSYALPATLIGAYNMAVCSAQRVIVDGYYAGESTAGDAQYFLGANMSIEGNEIVFTCPDNGILFLYINLAFTTTGYSFDYTNEFYLIEKVDVVDSILSQEVKNKEQDTKIARIENEIPFDEDVYDSQSAGNYLVSYSGTYSIVSYTSSHFTAQVPLMKGERYALPFHDTGAYNMCVASGGRSIVAGYVAGKTTNAGSVFNIGANMQKVDNEIQFTCPEENLYLFINLQFGSSFDYKDSFYLNKKGYSISEHFDKIDQKNEVQDNRLTTLENSAGISRFNSKTIYVFGDSLTWLGGDNCDGSRSGFEHKGWTEYFKEIINPHAMKSYARSGATLCCFSNSSETTSAEYGSPNKDNIVWNQIKRMQVDINNGADVPDYIIIAAGINDAMIYESTDPGSSYYSLNQVFQNLLSGTAEDVLNSNTSTSYFGTKTPSECDSLLKTIRWIKDACISICPNAQVVLLTPLQGALASLSTQKSISDIIEESASYISSSVINQRKVCGISRLQEAKGYHFTYDGTHTSVIGAKRVGYILAEKMKSLLY